MHASTMPIAEAQTGRGTHELNSVDGYHQAGGSPFHCFRLN